MCYQLCREEKNDVEKLTSCKHIIRERSGSVVECLTSDRGGRGFDPHRCHWVVVFEQDTFIPAFLFVCFVALRPKSTAMVIAGRSVHLTTLFPGQA